ncbi:hypothetical protein [Kocuria sp. TGY1127_2]|uniref:hypothetical protein n=1 Tax=Kocuria sp. TGY1127_2 TaxID=2711328 RepID=UPI0015B81DDC|nr:hypothetical protein [Kocuria sp. TGY1127_2]
MLLIVAGITIPSIVMGHDGFSQGNPRNPGDVSVMEDNGTIKVPGKFTSKDLRFKAQPHKQHWVSIEMKAEMPLSKAKAAFLKGTATCHDDTGHQVFRKQATENILQNDSAVFDLDGVLNTGDYAGTISCELAVEAPSGEAAARGVEVSASTYLAVSDPLAQGKDVRSTKALPQTLGSGSSRTLYQETDSIPQGSRHMQVSLVLQTTSCTIVNGSRDPNASGPLCNRSLLDKGGSQLRTVINGQVLDAQGRICSQLKSISADHKVTYDQHHFVLSLGSSDTGIPSCGKSVRFSVKIVNEGPAGAVIHSEGTSMSLAFRDD